ncbi:MAG: glycosyltransferase family 4 protein [Bryobacteraceae bacterium]
MRVLLAHNSLYYPSFGGGDKSNRLLMEALAARGHRVRVVGRVEHFGAEAQQRLLHELNARSVRPESCGASVEFNLNGVEVCILARDGSLRAYFASHVQSYDPDIILTSTDDAAHLMLETALRAPRARVVYMVRATIALPFGPDSSLPSAFQTDALRQADGVVAVSEYVAAYTRQWGGLDAVHVPISLLEPGGYPDLGRFENRFVSIVNPCAVKGISVFLGLAERFPATEFAAVPTWGTTAADIAAMRRQPNVSILPATDHIDDLLRQTRVMLVPSLWAEARSRVILEAMSRGIPVLASAVGGLAEAKLGVDYLLPVNPVVRYRSAVDELMVPAAEIPPQNIEPWSAALAGLLTDRENYQRLSAESRRAALSYARELTVLPFEAYLNRIASYPKRPALSLRKNARLPLSDERRHLLAMRLKRMKRHVAE